MVIKSTNINKGTIILTELTEHKNTTTCEVENGGPGLGQAQKCGGVNQLMWSQLSSVDNWISHGNAYIR